VGPVGSIRGAASTDVERTVAGFLCDVGFDDTDGRWGHLFSLPSARSFWFGEDQIDDAAQWAVEQSDAREDVYLGVGLANHPGTEHQRIKQRAGGADEIMATGIRALALDIDLAHEMKPGKSYCPDVTAALDILREYQHPPNLIVLSGTGLHAWWLFKEPCVFGSDGEREDVLGRWRTLQADTSVLFAERGYRIDATADLARVLRIPGTVHQRTGNVVAVLEADQFTQTARYAPSDFDIDPIPEALRSFKGTVPDIDLAAELPRDVFAAWLDNNPDARKVWTLEDSRFSVSDLSAPEMSLADRMALAHNGAAYLFGKDEIAAAIRTFRQTHADRITDPQVGRHKLRKVHSPYYLGLTVGKALSLRDPEAEAADGPSPTNETPSAGEQPRVEAAKGARPRGKSQKTLAFEIATKAEPDVFRDQDDEPVCIIPGLSAFEVTPINGPASALNSHMAAAYCARRKAVLSPTARRELLDHFTALSLLADRRDVALRIGRHEGRVLYHLRPGVLVGIGPDGWDLTKRSPIPFRWTPSMQPHGDPPSPGSWEGLLRLWGGRLREEDLALAIAWLLGAMKPGGPYPLLAIVGQQGSAKSTLAKQLKRIVDPSGPGGVTVYTPPRDRTAEDVFSLARGSHLLVWDNVSTLGDALSDVLSALATGAGVGARKKYTDFDPATTYACRPLVLTSIPDAVRRADLRDRAIIVEPLGLEGQHRDEQDVWAETEAAVLPTLGALFTACSAALRHWREIRGPFPRMADFSRWVMAAELGGAMPWEVGRFAEAYARNREGALGTLVAGTTWAEPFVEYAFDAHRDNPHPPNRLHSAARVLGDLTRALEPPERQYYPADPARFAGELRRIAPALLALYGLRVEFRRTHGRRHIATTWEEGALERYASREPDTDG